ncbi:MAG: biotin/lipoyl-binding protein, partial [Rhizobiaceae bacterium]|nr:biotin/lipoyl-binding protein [Rhizobiaceae bacterium]
MHIDIFPLRSSRTKAWSATPLRRTARRLPSLMLLVCGALASCNQQTPAQNNAAAVKPEVSVLTLRPQSVAITAEVPGRTAASLIAEVRPQVGGIIRARNFKEGSDVKAGDILYEIDPGSYQASYDSAVASLQKAQGALPSAQAKVDRYKGLTSQDAVSKQDL